MPSRPHGPHDLPTTVGRYLVPFDPRDVPQLRFDVLVLGAGSAGGTAALRAAEAGASVAVLTKGPVEEGNTRWAKGGLAAVLSPS